MTLMHRWFEEVWNQGRESAIDEMSFHDVPGHGLQGPDEKEVNGMEAFKAYYRHMRAALSDIHVQVEDVVSEGDLMVARCVVTAKHTGEGLGKQPKGNSICFTGMTMARIKEGKIAEAWNNFDFLTMYQQME
ncbi:MAG: ester cyclase [Acidobacteriota bacterium]|nr:ester cyclase [Acidobacteriota bacterium]